MKSLFSFSTAQDENKFVGGIGENKIGGLMSRTRYKLIEIVILPNGRSSFKSGHALASVHHGICHPHIVINMPHFI